MDLRERLRLLKAARAARRPQSTPAEGANPIPAALSPLALGGKIEGRVVQNACGEAFYVEHRYPIEYRRGPLALEHVLGLDGAAWGLVGRVPDQVNIRSAVFIDTETTGLAGGTGTYAFLIGLGFFRDAEFVVRQYFLRDYGEEEAILEQVEADLSACSMLVSFNGKSFDWPLIETRYRMSRRRPPLAGVPHLDLLHPSRRIWRDRLGHCNLTHLESEILGVTRYGDVPGHLIPQLYFDYLRTGQVAPLEDVMLHNRLDILSLVSLAGWLGQVALDPLQPSPDGELLGGDDLMALGRLLEDRGQIAQALICLEAACQRGSTLGGESRLMHEFSRLCKRVGELQRAASIWQEMIDLNNGSSLLLYPYLEMAKYHEHTTRQYATAQEIAQRALEIAHRRRALGASYGPATLKDVTEIEHRLNRLERKLMG